VTFSQVEKGVWEDDARILGVYSLGRVRLRRRGNI
jgi:hypothetical protein